MSDTVERRRGALLTSAALGLFVSTLVAADAAVAQAQQEGLQAEQAEEGSSVEEIVITGSRIRRTNLLTTAPVTSVSGRDIELSGKANLIDVLDDSPALLTSANSAASVGDAPEGSGTVSGGLSDGLGLLNLRALGTKRTLTLVNGKRHVGGRAGDTAVDVNSIPALLVDRVETFTGGASAIYGADGVSGVVNFILKDDFEGFDFRGQFDINDSGDGEEFFFTALAGSNFDDDKGNVSIALEYRNTSRLKCGERDFCRNNGIGDDLGNPALRFQESDITPEIRAAGFGVGDFIPTGATPGVPASLIERAANAAPRLIGKQPTFSISSKLGRFGIDLDGDGDNDGASTAEALGFFLDTDNNGVNDVGQTFLGQFGFGDWVVGQSGDLRLFNTGTITDFANQFGGDGIENNFDSNDLIPRQERVIAQGMFDYELHERVNFYSNAKFVYNETNEISNITAFNDLLTIRLDNPFIPTELRTAIDAAADQNPEILEQGAIFMTRDFIDLGFDEDLVERYTLRFVGGIEGTFENGISYDISFNYGRTDEDFTQQNARVEDRFFAAIDVTTDPETGEPICRSELDPDAPPPATSPFPFVEPGFRTFQPGNGECVPLNLFGLGAPSAEAAEFVTTNTSSDAKIEQQVFSAVFNGDTAAFFQMPFGLDPIGWSAGLEYRDEDSSLRFDNFTRTGLVFDGTQSRGVDGGFDVWEGFGEVLIPLVQDKPFFRDLTVEGAVRFSDYSTIGETTTWKVGANWSPTEDIRFRGTFSVAIRAPNVGELFQGETTAFFRPIDPCDQNEINAIEDSQLQNVRTQNCRAAGIPEGFTDPLTGRFAGEVAGNPNLREEEADTITIGTVITPRWIPNLAITVDYWDIELDDAIQTVSAQDIVNNCFNNPGGLDNQFCALVGRNRNPNSDTFLGLNFIRQAQVNIGKREVAGIDWQVRYSLPLVDVGLDSRWGNVDFSVNGTWQDKVDDFPDQNNPEFVNPELEEIRRPEWAVNGTVRWDMGPLTTNYQIRWMSRQVENPVEIENISGFVNPRTGDAFIHDLSFNYDFTQRMSAFAGVNNIGDRDPFLTSSSFPASPLGRQFFLGFAVNL